MSLSQKNQPHNTTQQTILTLLTSFHNYYRSVSERWDWWQFVLWFVGFGCVFFFKKSLNFILNLFYTLFDHLAVKQVAIHRLVAVAVKICEL